jgi:hypothetical protein
MSFSGVVRTDDHAASSWLRRQLRGQPRNIEPFYQSQHEGQVHAAHHVRVLFRQAMKRAVPQLDRAAAVLPGLEAMVAQRGLQRGLRGGPVRWRLCPCLGPDSA